MPPGDVVPHDKPRLLVAQVRALNRIGAFEAHVSYDVKPRLWGSSRLGPQ